MTKIKRFGLIALTVVCCWHGANLLRAQQKDAPEGTTKPEQPVALEDAAPVTSDAGTNSPEKAPERRGNRREAIVLMGSNAEVKAGETVGSVVVIGGNAVIHGEVEEAVVVIGGNIETDGEIGEAAVAVMGNIIAKSGAKLHEVVTVGGRFKADEGVDFDGSPVEIDPGGVGTGLRDWVVHCVLKLRPLAPQVGWVWMIWGAFVLIYLLVAAVLAAPVRVCVSEIGRKPVTTFFMGLLTKLLIPFVLGLLIVTGIGVVVVPFVLAAVMFGAIVGKVALLEVIGGGIAGRFGAGAGQRPLAAFLVGVLLLTVLYMIPVIGLITFGIVTVWGLGCAVTATFASLRRELPDKSVAAAREPALAAMAGASGSGTGYAPQPFNEPGTQAQPATGAVPPMPSAPVPEVLAYPKASFWERMGAAFLDLVLLGVISGFVGRAPFTFLLALAYFAGMWTWKGTTIGGIVLGLKVVRVDGQPVSFVVALVRGLAAAFSAMVLFLGFLWIAWDKDKQGWHDMIAGTVVLRLPRGTPLVCF